MNPTNHINRKFARAPLAHGVQWALAIAALSMSGVVSAQAQDPAPAAKATESQDTTTLDTVSVLGSRSKPRTESTSAVPIDIIDGAELRNQGATDVLDQLRVMVPSFNVSTIPIDDAATLVRPANLRGLPPDNTLILVNGKRRHRSAVITFLGHGLSDGAQGPDISVFPSLALEQVEVLRDGAAAQYGSDAIAGVINFGLKQLNKGGTLEAFAGQYYEGDGFTQQYSGQLGMSLMDRGFATLTAEWRSADATSRSVQRNDAAGVAAAGYPSVPNPAQIWGSPEVKDDLKVVVNMGIPGDSVDFYAFGNYAKRDVDGGFYYRNPTSRGGVYTADGGQTLLIGDLNPTNGITCPTINLRAPNRGALLPYAGIGAAVAALPAECFTFLKLYPGGFTPRFGGEMQDLSVTGGLRGQFGGDWHWDLSGSYGRNEVDFYMYNTLNPSLGPNQPAGSLFRPGGNVQTETNFNFDIGRDFETSFTSEPVTFTSGLEWRKEEYQIKAGDAASTGVGPLYLQGFDIGSNGFPGFNARTAGAFSRSNWAVYADAQAQFTERLLLAAALRYEDFSDFGGTLNGKLTGRFDFTDNFAVRGAYNTGFRAPTPGQSNASQVTTSFNQGQLEDTATLSPTNPIAVFYGAKPLTSEDSSNISLGLVWDSGPWLVTADWYQIKMEDRITRGRDIRVTPAERAALVAAGNVEAASITNVTFFVNDFDTTTTGFDLVASYGSDHFGGKTTYSLAANWNQTRVENFNPVIITPSRVKRLEESLPRTKGYLSVNHQREVFSANLRLSYYGSFFEDHLDNGLLPPDPDALPIYGDSAFTVDAEAGWKFASGLYFKVGAQNLFDKVPDENPWGAPVAGAQYPVHTPYGFNGGFYYARVGWTF